MLKFKKNTDFVRPEDSFDLDLHSEIVCWSEVMQELIWSRQTIALRC